MTTNTVNTQHHDNDTGTLSNTNSEKTDETGQKNGHINPLPRQQISMT